MLDRLVGSLDNNYEMMLLEVRKDNRQAYAFYQRNGFLTVEDRGEKWLMQRTLCQNL